MRCLIAALVLLTGCAQSECLRQSDCPEGQRCNGALVCEAIPTDDAGTDAAVLDMPSAPRDIARAPTPCRDALQCYVFTRTFDQPKCLVALSPDDAASVHDEFVCAAGGIDHLGNMRGAACPIECGRQVNSVELRDPQACWICAVGKLGGQCVEACR